MNFLNGTYSKGKVTVGEHEIALSKKDVTLLEPYEGKPIILGARPETISLKADCRAEHPAKAWKSECDYAELLGYELVLYTTVEGQKLILKTPATAEVENHDMIEYCFDLDKLYFFDPETEERIR